MAKSVIIKPTDNAAQLKKESHRNNRLNSIKNELESGHMANWSQLFAIISETKLSIELGISFYAFRRKWQDPGKFTLKDLMRMAALFGVKYDIISKFIWDMIKSKSKSRIFKD